MIAWRRAIVFVHRWLGIAGWLLFVMWFATGIVMMYARMPALGRAERRGRQAPLDLSTARLAPAEALRKQHLVDPERVVVTMLAGRPVYRVLAGGAWTTIFADDGERIHRLSAAQAVEEVRRFAPESAATIRYDARISEPDQWTLEDRSALPLHRVRLGDAEGSVVYLAERTGELVAKTNGRERWLAYAGAVPHWLYFTPLRRHPRLWTGVIVWTSAAGGVMCLLGLVWGIQAGTGVGVPGRVAYGGWMRWHHYAGLTFGVVSFTWFFSGLLSMDPLDWHATNAPTPVQRQAFSGGSLRLDGVSLDDLRRAGASGPAAAKEHTGAKEIEIGQFGGQRRLIADGRANPIIDPDRLLAAAVEAMPGAALTEVAWLDDYDAYYYDRQRELPLPVMRVRYEDPRATWLYVDPSGGTIVRKEERSSRLNRWLYHGLHSLDFPFLYNRRPLWDAVVILFILGGIASALTSATPAWRRLRRHARRLL